MQCWAASLISAHWMPVCPPIHHVVITSSVSHVARYCLRGKLHLTGNHCVRSSNEFEQTGPKRFASFFTDWEPLGKVSGNLCPIGVLSEFTPSVVHLSGG